MNLPGVTEGRRYQQRTWFVGTNGFAWERPFSKADIKRFGDEAVPAGPILAVTVADLADKQAIYPLAGQAAALVGPIDLLIHNASTLGPTPLRLLLDSECEDLEHVLAVNLVGPFRLSKVLAGAMALRGDGVVLHISSDAAVEAYPTWGAYGVAKAAQDHLSRIFAAELAGTGVRVLAVDPGEMDTAMHAAALPDADRSSLADPAAVARRITDMLDDPARAPSGARLSAATRRAEGMVAASRIDPPAER